MIESLSQSNLAAITVGMLSILSLALGVLAILKARALSRPRRRRSTWV